LPTASRPGSVGTAPDGGQSHRILEIDGLRGCAIALVLFCHYFQITVEYRPATLLSYLFVPGRLTWSGVDLFFVLSGFLIGGILLDARAATNYFRVFYTRRFFRIVPIYFLLLLGFVAFRLAVGHSSQAAFSGNLTDAMPLWTYPLFLQNFWMAAAGTFGGGWLAVTWSLAVEEQFYLTLPSIVRFLSHRVIVVCVILGIVAAPVLRVVLFRPTPTGWFASYVLLFCRADALLFGVLCALLLRSKTWATRIANSSYWFPGLLLSLLAVAAFLTKIGGAVTTLNMASYGYTSLAALYACVLLFVCTRPGHLFAAIARWRPLRWLGSIAYGVYLLHMPVQGVMYALVFGGRPRIFDLQTLLFAFLTLGITLSLAHASWNYFEKRLVKFSHRAQYEFQTHSETVGSGPLPAGVRQ
jgi:peptidoglycan/LPS O-acetylase OafA/YrhL